MHEFLSAILAPTQVIAYHGGSLDTLRRVMRHEPLLPSVNAYDWLGEGVYFWEYCPYRA